MSFVWTLCMAYCFVKYTFIPQCVFLSTFHGPSDFISAVTLVLAEWLVLLHGLYGGSHMDEAYTDTFDVR